MLFAHAVAVRQAALHDIGEDLHIAMTVRPKAFARRDAVLVQNAQRLKIVVRRIGIAPEGKRLILLSQPSCTWPRSSLLRMVIICAPSEILAARPIRRDGRRSPCVRAAAAARVFGAKLVRSFESTESNNR